MNVPLNRSGGNSTSRYNWETNATNHAFDWYFESLSESGTAIGITEYNWGAENHMNGATAQADILGILGREGVDLATRWTAPATNTPVARAFQLYRNYDGAHAAFGETSVRATAPAPDTVAAFASVRRADGAMTGMLINKQPTTNAPLTIAITNFTHVDREERARDERDPGDCIPFRPADVKDLVPASRCHGRHITATGTAGHEQRVGWRMCWWRAWVAGWRCFHSSFLVGESISRCGAGALRRWGVGGNGEAEAALQAADVDRRAVQASGSGGRRGWRMWGWWAWFVWFNLSMSRV